MVSVCRLCASLKKTEKLTFIRDSNHEFCQKLFKCCQLSIDLKDVLPKGVCPECVQSLNASFEFYKRVHESQQSLRQLLNIGNALLSEEADEMDVDETSKDHGASAMMAAVAACGIEKHPDVTPSPTANEENEEEVKRVIDEILGVKDEQQVYLEFESDNEDDTSTTDKVPEVDSEDVTTQNSVNSIIIPDTGYTGIELIEEEEEVEIGFDNHQYEIIEEEEDDEEQVEDVPVQGQQQYEQQETDAIAMGVLTKPASPLAATDAPPDTWIDYSWKCGRCSVTCVSPEQLTQHNEQEHLIHASDMEWVCADCQKSFPRYYSLITHIRQRHRTYLALYCDICNERCDSFKELEEHRTNLHTCEEHLIMFLCAICGKGFHTTNSLQMHGKCHLPDDQRMKFSCDLCGKKFRTTTSLKFHYKMHAGTRDFVCDQCGKKFVQKGNLEEHLVSHLNFTPYECCLCNKFFKTPERLARHKVRHTDEKPFSCSECGKTFRTKDAMTTHMRIHTGEMPFRCEFCQKPFRFRSTLITHHNVHTGTRPYSCLDCDHHFTNWPNYNKHMKRRHGVDVSSKNPRGKKPSVPRKKPVTSYTIVKKEGDFTIRCEADGEDEPEPEPEPEQERELERNEEEMVDDIGGITITKMEEESQDNNYENDAI